MNCQEFRERLTVQLADGSEPAGDHGATCPDCARYAERAKAAWDAAGRIPDEAVPPEVAENFHRSCRRPRRADLTLLRPGPLAAAAVLVVSLAVLFWPAKAVKDDGSMFDADGTSVERIDLPAGVDAERAAAEIRREVAPESWREGVCGMEVGEGFLRVRGPAEIQRAVREHVRKLQR